MIGDNPQIMKRNSEFRSQNTELRQICRKNGFVGYGPKMRCMNVKDRDSSKEPKKAKFGLQESKEKHLANEFPIAVSCQLSASLLDKPEFPRKILYLRTLSCRKQGGEKVLVYQE